MAAARPAPEVYPVAGTQALAPEPHHHQQQPQPDQQPVANSEPVPESPRRAPYQPALFSTRDLGRVVPIQAYQTRAAERRERAKQAEAAARRHHPPAGAMSLQTDFAFDPDQQQREPALAGAASAAAMPSPRRPGASGTSPHLPEARYSRAPVAIPMHRTMAAAIDLGMMTVAAGLVCLLISFGTGEWPLPGKPLHWFGGLGAVLSILYKLVWAAADADSPGLRWCHLRLLHFDGREPLRRERFERIAWSLLSIMAGGLGLIWALVDEESLCWHDHSSKTFLTPYSQVQARIHRS